MARRPGSDQTQPRRQATARIVSGLTLDTGALIALEGKRQRMAGAYRAAVEAALPITVPSPVLVEWWRRRSDAREAILRGVHLTRLQSFFPGVRLLAV